MSVEAAVEVLRSGGLVAFPTETVYGLGADARNEAAVRRLFDVKERPLDRALSLCVGGLAAAQSFAVFDTDAIRLAAAFWPGPLTLVLPRRDVVGDGVTGGRDTVGLRMPAHPVALALLRDFGGAIAAPSANKFGEAPPVTASEVVDALGEDVDLVLDGGLCQVGESSTVLSLVGEPTILRAGAITQSQIERVLERLIR
jgi:L-threonylcarbamoyladenylate synthase